MWIFANNAFISIVASDRDPDLLAVRARVKGDIERLFPDAIVIPAAPKQDYAFRAFIPREEVAVTIGDALATTNYTNFKASVVEEDRHDFYLDVWYEALRFQRWRLIGNRRGKKGYRDFR